MKRSYVIALIALIIVVGIVFLVFTKKADAADAPRTVEGNTVAGNSAFGVGSLTSFLHHSTTENKGNPSPSMLNKAIAIHVAAVNKGCDVVGSKFGVSNTLGVCGGLEKLQIEQFKKAASIAKDIGSGAKNIAVSAIKDVGSVVSYINPLGW